MKTVVGSFDSTTQAEAVIRDLTASGFPRDDISIVARRKDRQAESDRSREEASDTGSDVAKGAVTGGAIGGIAGLVAGLAGLAIPGIGPVIAAGPIAAALAGAGVGAVAGGIIGALTDVGVPEEDAHVYAENVRRGGALVLVRCEDARAQACADIMQRHGAVDIERRGQEWRRAGWRGFDANAQPHAADSREETVIPVVEEELKVGKREVEEGRVRVYAHTVERPVSETVNLREEEVQVSRRPVDRPATERDLQAGRDREMEFRETREEPVVQKEARVVEEVEVGKQARQRTEQVSDKVRRTEVDVDKDAAHRPPPSRGAEGRTPPPRP